MNRSSGDYGCRSIVGAAARLDHVPHVIANPAVLLPAVRAFMQFKIPAHHLDVAHHPAARLPLERPEQPGLLLAGFPQHFVHVENPRTVAQDDSSLDAFIVEVVSGLQIMHIDGFSPAAAGPLEDDDTFDIVAEPAMHYYHAFLQSFDF